MENNTVDAAEKILKQEWAKKEIKFIIQSCSNFGHVGEDKDKLENLIQAMEEGQVSPEDAIVAANTIFEEKLDTKKHVV